MRRLTILLSSIALLGAFVFGSAVVRADDSSGSSDTSQCQPAAPSGGSGTAEDRIAVAADDRNGTSGDDNENGTSSNDNISGQGGDDQIGGNQGDADLCGD